MKSESEGGSCFILSAFLTKEGDIKNDALEFFLQKLPLVRVSSTLFYFFDPALPTSPLALYAPTRHLPLLSFPQQTSHTPKVFFSFNMQPQIIYTLQISENLSKTLESFLAREDQEKAQIDFQSAEIQRKKIAELKDINAHHAARLGELQAAEATRDAAERKCAELTKALESAEQEVVKANEKCEEECENYEDLREEHNKLEHKNFSLEKQVAILQKKLTKEQNLRAQTIAQKDGEITTYADELDKAHLMSKKVVEENRVLEEELAEQLELNESLVEQLEEQKEASNELNEQLEQRIRELEEQLADKEVNEKRLRSKVTNLKRKMGDTSPVLARENHDLKRKLHEAELAVRDNLPQYTIVVEPKNKRCRTFEEHYELITKDFAPFDASEEFDPKKFLEAFDSEITLKEF